MKLKKLLLLVPVFLVLAIGLTSLGKLDAKYLNSLSDKSDFEILEGQPLVLKFGNVQGVKVVYDIQSQKIYYVNGKAFKYHSEFCVKELGWRGSHIKFNNENYSSHKNQRYILANINYYQSLNKYVLEFSVANEIDPNQIQLLYNEIVKSVYFSTNFHLLLNNKNSKSFKASTELRVISIEEVYQNQSYQPLHKSVSLGRLSFIKHQDVMSSGVEPTDIIVIDGSPNVLPVNNGVITTDLQGPLSHITLLGVNRDIPIMMLQNAWENETLKAFEGEYVELEVKQDTFEIRKVSQVEFGFSNQNRRLKVSVRKNVKYKELVDAIRIKKSMVNKVGGKAANFGLLAKMKFKGRAKVPEGAFAIPFFHYNQHMITSGAQKLLDSLLLDTQKGKVEDFGSRLKEIRKTIKKHELDSALYKAVEQKIMAKMGKVKMRFRSSTNAEDIDGFNGAGLYKSKSGIPKSLVKPIDVAIKKVWASLWLERAFQEREIFKIAQEDVAMGILVHRAFPEEKANGVAITTNLYRPNYPGFTISVQEGEVSVVAPENGEVADHYLAFTNKELDFTNQDISLDWVSSSSVSKTGPVLSEEETLNLMRCLSVIKNSMYSKASFFEGMSYYDYALDIEFKIVGEQRDLYIKQVRRFNKSF